MKYIGFPSPSYPLAAILERVTLHSQNIQHKEKNIPKIMKILLSSLLLFFLISEASFSQNAKSLLANNSDVIGDKNILIVNQFDSLFVYDFCTTDNFSNYTTLDFVNSRIEFSSKANYQEIRQNFQFARPVFWCKPGLQSDLISANRKTHTATFISTDSIANNEINFFQILNDSIFGGSDLFKEMNRIEEYLKQKKYSILVTNDYNRKICFLEWYQETNKVSPLFDKLCRSLFLGDYVHDLIIATSKEPNKLDSLTKIILNAKSSIQNDDLLFSFKYQRNCDIFNSFLAKNYFQKNKVSVIELYQSAKSNFTGDTKDFLMFTMLNYAISDKTLTVDQIQTLLSDFNLSCTNSEYKRSIDEKVKAKAFASTLSNDQVYNISLRKFPLSQVIKQNRGKLIYVDFWASWCEPCRVLMKDSKKVHQLYNDKVTFLYISIDKDFGAWKKANFDEGLSEIQSFCISNDALFIKQHNVKSIPRYMLFDKNGVLITDNAPRPNTKELITLLNKHK